MTRRGTGLVFCLIAAFFYAVRFTNAAIYSPKSIGPWGSDIYASYVGYVGPPWIVIWICLIIGVGYLVWAERDNRNK